MRGVLGIHPVYANHWRIRLSDTRFISLAVDQIEKSNLMPSEMIYNPQSRLMFVRFQPAITAAQLNEVVGCGYENLLQISAETFDDWTMLAMDTGPVGLQSRWCIWKCKPSDHWHLRLPDANSVKDTVDGIANSDRS